MVDARISEIRALLPRALLADWVRLGSRLVRVLRDEHHPGRHTEVLDRLLAQARASVILREQRARFVPAVSYPQELPITRRKDEIVAAIRAHQVVVIAGETGSGKTTQLPKMCLEAGLGIEAKIGCTQPRRVAALSISQRIAEELDVTWGREVGCKIRFDDRSSPETYIKLMTDGILLAETQGDPLLAEYNAIIIDEAHERSLNIDFLLGHLKNLLAKRPELKMLITSATIDTASFAQAFNNAPVIEVSGRVYPVAVVYAPLDQDSEESGELTYIEAAARAVERVLCEPGRGDALVFMPTERDIRETCDLLRDRYETDAEIIPLFGRLSAGEQQRVFAPCDRRKIVVATNIAETSLTIPGIRYVIDAGLARISRYNPRTRARRLPIEPVSQSSANQRKGRSGRVQEGVCIRLYSEADFLDRPAYTQPEIQRANLAEVILRMKAFRLGEIETFPFINPPSPAAIQGGYALLQELGALDPARELTPLGRDLARLPIDPTLGRMLLHAQTEHASRELLIIAAGLSIQDPRERPLDKKDLADAAHKRFADPASDFLTLLNLWNAVHEQWEGLRTQNQRRKFCKANFLSYTRMREWQDLHAQLEEALEGTGRLRLSESNASYAAVHRSVLAGLLAHVGRWKERNTYQTSGNRLLTVFPGSALYDRGEKPRRAKGRSPAKENPPPERTSQPEWIMAGEMVETTQLFARTVAGIDPLWIIDLAPHLCKVECANPHWSASAGRVLAEETTSLYGLEIRKRRVAYGNVNPREATAIFIRSALVEGELFPDPVSSRREEESDSQSNAQLLASATALDERRRPRYPFLEHNQKVRQKIETWQTRSRRHDVADPDQALCDFYAQRIENVSSIHDLDRFLREHPDPDCLRVTEADLAGGLDLSFDAQAFPDAVPLGGQPVALSYAYAPGEEQDGITLKLHPSQVETLPGATVEYAVPGLREAQISELLRALPKAIRRRLMPFPPKVEEILREFQPSGSSLRADLSRFIQRRYGVEVPVSAWPAEALPAHLRPRIEVVGGNDKTIATGRDLNQLREHLEKVKTAPVPDPADWVRLAQKWERFGVREWTFGDLPERITVAESPPLYAWPGLEMEDGQVNLRLFRARDASRRASRQAVERLLELGLHKDLAWLQKDLHGLARLVPLVGSWQSSGDLERAAYDHLKTHLFPEEPFPALAAAHFEAALAKARGRLPGLALEFINKLEPILKLRQEVLRRVGPPPARSTPAARTLSDLRQLGSPSAPAPAASRPASPVLEQLEKLLPRNFLETTPFERLDQLPRYLKALLVRAERAALNPLKDQERARQLAPYEEALARLRAEPVLSPEKSREIEAFRWMVEEFNISLFAQELGTAMPVSPKRLDQQLQKVRQAP